jgi:hypothetical protein
MSTLWVFGDSYTHHSESNQEVCWTYQLAKKLGVKTYYNRSQYGVSNEYICSGFEEVGEKIKPTDFIILIVTWKGRQWFFEERPEISNLNMMSHGLIDKEYGKQYTKAVKQFEKYLDNDRLVNIKLTWYYGYLNFIETHFPNTLIIPGFDNGMHSDYNFQVEGNLYSIGKNEFETPAIGDKIFTKKWASLDRRVGHLAKENHKILAEKVYNTFTHKHILDLNNGYKKEFINLKNYEDYVTIDPADIQTF